MKRINPKITENMVMRAVCEYLTYKRIFFYRQNNVPICDAGVYRRMPKYSIPGVSDLLALPYNRTMFLECKSPTGKQSQAQKEFEKNVKASGHEYYIIRSVEDVERALNNEK